MQTTSPDGAIPSNGFWAFYPSTGWGLPPGANSHQLQSLFCFNSGVNQSTPSLSMLLLQASGCQQQPMLERIRVIGSFRLSRSSRCRKDRDRPIPKHSILKKYRVRRLSGWLDGQDEILRLSNGWLVCRSQNEYVVLPDTSSWQSQNFFMESKIVKLLHIGWRFWFLEDRFLLLLDWLWLTQYLQCAETP